MKPVISILYLGAALLAAPLGVLASSTAASIDYCADQYLIEVADPNNIIAVSRGGDDDYSFHREKARLYPALRASIEEAAALRPSIILRQWGGGPNAEAAFSRTGAKVVSLEFASDFSGVRRNLRMVGAALGQETSAEKAVTTLDNRLQEISKGSIDPQITALYVTPGGVTAGRDTMIDAIFSAAGVSNKAGHLEFWAPMPAERILADPPDLIVAGFFDSDGERINHWSAARHPALTQLFNHIPTVHLTPDLISCAGAHSVRAVEMIHSAAAQINAS